MHVFAKDADIWNVSTNNVGCTYCSLLIKHVTALNTLFLLLPQDGRSKLSLIRQSIDSLKDKAPQLDLLLQGARLTVTRDGAPVSCLDMVNALLRKLEEVDGALANQQQSLQKETQNKSLGVRRRTLLGEMRRLQDTIEKQGLKEPTMPAVQQRCVKTVLLEFNPVNTCKH